MDVENVVKKLENKPLCLLVIGMAGSGKTTFVKALKDHITGCDKPAYTINLDPAVHYIPYSPNIDIRDSIKYKEVMQNYNLGPNGAILTSLNLFSTEMNELVELIDSNSSKTNHVIIDFPGQIEVFKWSASGKIITQSLASSFPTAIIFIIDSKRCENPLTFMSNMLYASGVAVEYELPFVMVMNKVDKASSDYIERWMENVEEFADDLDKVNDLGYTKSLTRQMATVFEEFYIDLKRCGVSSFTGQGLESLNELLKSARQEYFDVYLPAVLAEKESEPADMEDSIFIGQFNDGGDDEFAEENSDEEPEENNEE